MPIYKNALFVCLLGTMQCASADDSMPVVERIAPDRRDFTSGTGIVPLGGIQVESGLTWERSDSQRRIAIGDVTLRIPIFTSMELHLGLPSYLVRDQDGRTTGLDDATIEARWQFYHGGLLDLALQVVTILPTGSRNVAEHDWQPGAVFASTLKITESIEWVSSLGVNRGSADGKRFSQTLAASSFRVDVAPRWNIFAEAYILSRESADGPSHRYVDIGTVYFISNATALDARIGKGIRNGGDTNTFASAGLSHKF